MIRWRRMRNPRFAVRGLLRNIQGPCHGPMLTRISNNGSVPSCSFTTGLRPKSSCRDTDLYSLNKKISHLIRTGRIFEARALFDSTKNRNTVTWNSMISGYVQRREMGKARKLFNELPERDIVSWNLMISGYISCRGSGYIEEGRKLFDNMPERDCVSWNTMISGYAKNGKMDEALRLFTSMPKRNVVSWNAMITGFLRNGNVVRAIEFFERMPERDAASLSALISGLIQNDELDKAERVLFEFGNKDEAKEDLVHAYNTLIAGYGQVGRVEEARHLFDHIPFYHDQSKEGNVTFKRNLVSWNSMIMCLVKVGDIASARELFDLMAERDTFSWNTMISGFMEIGSLTVANDFFERMPQRNLVSWNSMIAGYEKNEDYNEAAKLFTQMLLEGEKPDRHTLSSVLSVCTGLVDLHLGMQIHQLVTKTVIPDVPIYNSLITMYSRCGAINQARTIFGKMKMQKDVISWNAMIGGYASHGFSKEAIELFEVMRRLKVRPTYITFISVLHACAHAGLVEEGRKQFKSMTCEFDIEPRVEHFAALVDIVGRHGQLEEAMDLINTMPCEPDTAVWGALLSACRVHQNVELARVAAEALMRLEPKSSAPYVLLYNMYADVGQWDDAAEIRMLMEKNNIIKQPGYSWVDSSN